MESTRLTLLPCTIAHLEKLIEGATAFEAAYGLRVIEGYLEFDGALEYALQILQDQTIPTEWFSYLFIHRADQAVIGFGGYKGQPDAEGSVEIGYGIAPAYRGKGYATEAAQAMIQHAFTIPTVTRVFAHTLAVENPSTGVLRKVGMQKVATIHDIEDGDIWRWEVNQ